MDIVDIYYFHGFHDHHNSHGFLHFHYSHRFPDILNILEILDGHPESLTFQNVGGMGMPEDFNDRMMEHYVRIAERRAKKGRLGIRPGSYTESGLELVSVRESSAAAKAGIQGSDIVVAIDGRKILTSKDIRQALAGKLKGTEVSITLRRSEGEVEITAVLD